MVIVAWLIPLFLVPNINLKPGPVQVGHPVDDIVEVSVSDVRKEFDSCLDGGFEAAFRYEVRLCRKREYWWDACADKRTELRFASFDPVSETFEVERDRFGDDAPRERRSKSSREEAYAYLTAAAPWSMEFLARGDTRLLATPPHFVSVRLVVNCRGQSSETMLQFSSVLTLGLLTVSVLDTNWIDFPRPIGAGQ